MTDDRRHRQRGRFPFLLAAASILAAVLPVAGESAAPPEVFQRSAVRFWRLDNGLRLVVKEDHSAPVVAVNVVVRAGSRRETAQNNGISHFVEHMVFRAARAGGEDLLTGPIEAAGGVINGGTLRDFTHYTATVASRHLELALGALAKAIIHPTFDPSAALAERRVLAREAQHLADQPTVAAWDAAFQLAYDGHSYGLPIAGTEQSLARVDADALVSFHRRWYVPANASVVIVGDVGPAEAKAAVESAFSEWRSDQVETPPELPPLPPAIGPRERLVSSEVPEATVLMGFRAAGISHPREVCALDLLYAVLGEGYTARLKRALVDTGLADQVSVNFLTQELPGLFGIQAACTAERAAEVRRAMEEEVTRLQREPLTQEGLQRAKRRISRAYVFANETFEDQAATLGFYEALSSYEFALSYLDEVGAITAAELTAAAQAYLDPGRAVWVAIMPAARPGSAAAAPSEEPATR